MKIVQVLLRGDFKNMLEIKIHFSKNSNRCYSLKVNIFIKSWNYKKLVINFGFKNLLVSVRTFFYKFESFCFKVIVPKNQVSGNKCFSVISRLEITLSIVSYEWKNIIFYEKYLKLTENNTSDNVFGENIVYNSTVSNFKSKVFSSWNQK